MLGEHGAYVAVALNDVKDAIRQACFGKDFCQFHHGKRRDFAGLKHDCVACRQGRGGFPAGNLNWIVPSANGTNHTQRLAAGVDKGAIAQGNLAAFNSGRQACVVLQCIRAGDNIDARGFADRLTGVAGFQLGKLIIALS